SWPHSSERTRVFVGTAHADDDVIECSTPTRMVHYSGMISASLCMEMMPHPHGIDMQTRSRDMEEESN
ncbi:hypothetical protein IRJ41_020115, partial [Triplophysa rosa]